MPDKNGRGREPRAVKAKKPGGNQSLGGKDHRGRGKNRFKRVSPQDNLARQHAHSPPNSKTQITA